MDPLGLATLDDEGYITLNDNLRLHYELYRPPADPADPHAAAAASGTSSETAKPSPLLMLMGAFATKAHFAEMARYLADHSGHEVCIYDHRGVGRSSEPVLEAQTAAQLAADALVVADTLWGAGTPIHVYGASMGGMVAQELALLLIPQHRLLSLSLSITCRGMQPAHGLLGPLLTPKVLKTFFELWFWDSKPNLVRRLMRLLLTRNLLDSLHPCGETYGQVYYRAWLGRFDELWTFNSGHAAGACHAHVVLHQHMSDTKLAVIRDCGVPLVCQVSTHDKLIPPAMQFDLADKLRARTVTIPTGHMGFLPWKARFYNTILEQLAMGEAVRGVKQAQRTRASRTGDSAAAVGDVHTWDEGSGRGGGGGRGVFPVVGSASILVSLAKPLFTALSGGSRSSREYRQYSLTGATAAAGAAAAAAGDQPEQGLGVADTGAAGSATDNVDDMGSGSPACDVSAAGDSAADVAAASDMSVLLGREGDDAGFDKL